MQYYRKSYVELEKHPIKLHKEEESTLPVVYVSFVYTTNTPKAREYDNRNQMLKEINILNQYFVDENNQKSFGSSLTVIFLMKTLTNVTVI